MASSDSQRVTRWLAAGTAGLIAAMVGWTASPIHGRHPQVTEPADAPQPTVTVHMERPSGWTAHEAIPRRPPPAPSKSEQFQAEKFEKGRETILQVVRALRESPQSMLNREPLPPERISDPSARRFLEHLNVVRATMEDIEAEKALAPPGDPEAVLRYARRIDDLLNQLEDAYEDFPVADPLEPAWRHSGWQSISDLHDELAVQAYGALLEAWPLSQGHIRGKLRALLEHFDGTWLDGIDPFPARDRPPELRRGTLLTMAELHGLGDSASLWRAMKAVWLAQAEESSREPTMLTPDNISLAIERVRAMPEDTPDWGGKILEDVRIPTHEASAWRLKELYGDGEAADAILKRQPTPSPEPEVSAQDSGDSAPGQGEADHSGDAETRKDRGRLK